MAALNKFEIIRGTTRVLKALIRTDAGAAYDLSLATTINLYVAPSRNTVIPTITKALTIFGAPTLGEVRYTFVPADTSSLDSGDYEAEVHITNSDATEHRTMPPFIFRIIERVKA